ncbi:MAG: hypothetical protein Q9M24_01130 [Mariprofundaceae bacterium]|nr:hypothetical protein [Mariprofundaceae bacterium]
MPRLDIIITFLFAIGLGQGCWLTSLAARYGVPSSLILRALWSLTGIWVLFWPAYKNTTSIFAAIGLFVIVILLVSSIRHPAFNRIRLAWSDNMAWPWPMLMFTAALALAATFSTPFPEFGFGAALSVCLGLPLAHWLDRSGKFKLKFPANPAQTLPGHLSLIATVMITCGWSLHVFHQIGWFESLTATALAGIAASATRALIPHPFNLPGIATAIGGVLWIL